MAAGNKNQIAFSLIEKLKLNGALKMQNNHWITDTYSVNDAAMPLDDLQRYTNEEDEVGLFDSSVLFAAGTMHKLVHILEDLEITQGPLFAIESNLHGLQGRIVCACDPDAKDYSNHLLLSNAVVGQLFEWNEWLEVEQADADFPHAEIDPFADHFYRVAERLGLKLSTQQFNAAMLDNGLMARTMCDKLNALVSAMREMQCDAAIKKLRHNGIRTAKNDYQSLIEYQARLFKIYTRLLVVRVDLGYKKKVSQSILPTDFLSHLKKFCVALQRHSVFKYLVGYALKIEHGADRGFHVHGLFFFDGSKVQQDIIRGKMIGEHWESLVPYDIGSYFNCNAKASNFYNALGMVEYHDRDKRQGLLYLIQYLMKTDSAARVMLGNARTFMRGSMPELPAHNRGRHRSRNDCYDDLLLEPQNQDFNPSLGRRRRRG